MAVYTGHFLPYSRCGPGPSQPTGDSLEHPRQLSPLWYNELRFHWEPNPGLCSTPACVESTAVRSDWLDARPVSFARHLSVLPAAERAGRHVSHSNRVDTVPLSRTTTCRVTGNSTTTCVFQISFTCPGLADLSSLHSIIVHQNSLCGTVRRMVRYHT